MPLKLTITSYQRLSPDQEATKILDRGSLTIGRAPQSDWVLQDPERILSKLHGIVDYREGAYFLTDRSQNGIFYNDADERMPRDQALRINHGDRFALGEYEIEVTLQDEVSDFPETNADGLSTDLLPPGADLFGVSGSLVDEPAPERAATDQSLSIDPVPFNDLLSGQHLSGDLQRSAEAVSARAATARPPDLSTPERINFELPSLISQPPLGKQRTDAPLIAESAPTDPTPAAVHNPADQVLPAESVMDRLDPAPVLPSSLPEIAQEPPDDLAKPGAELLIPEDWWTQPPPAAPLGLPSVSFAPAAIPAQPAPSPFAPTHPTAPVAPAPAAQPMPPLSSPSAAADPSGGPRSDRLLQAFCEGAGLPRLKLTEEQLHRIMGNLGGMLRETVRGLMEILLARSDVKGEFQLDRTSMGPIENNPLKTPPGRPPLTAEEVMVLLLVGQKDAYMLPVQAVREGFDDIKAHQLAVMAGIQAALARLIERFDPENLETRLEQSVLDNLWPANRKAKYWDLFISEYQAIAHEAEDDFKKLFGDEFARAYENQLRLP